MRATVKIFIASAFVLSTLAGCDVKDPIYDSAGEVTLTTDWTATNLTEAPAAGYTVGVGEQSAVVTQNPASMENIFIPGTYTGYIYTAADKISVSGTGENTVATVAAATAPDGASGTFVAPDPAFLYSGSKEVTIEKYKEHNITVAMRQDVRELTLVITPDGDAAEKVESVTATLGGVAGTWNLHTDAAGGGAVSVAPVFTKQPNGDWQATVRLLGTNGATQTLGGTITFTPVSSLAPVTFSKPLHDVTGFPDFNSDKKTPLALEAHLVEVHNQLELGDFAAIPGWSGNDDNIDGRPTLDYVNSLAAAMTLAYDADASAVGSTNAFRFTFPAEGVEFATYEVTSGTGTLSSDIDNNTTLTISPAEMESAAGADIKVKYTITYGGVTSTAETSLTVPFTGVAKNALGGVYYENGVATGMVYIANTGTEGTGRAVSLKEENTANMGVIWGPDNTPTNASSTTDGLANMSKVAEQPNWKTNYPAFAWVDNLNPAETTYSTGATGIWYLPAYKELDDTAGGLYNVFDTDRSNFNTLLTSAGGVTFDTSNWPYYWSSTEFTNNVAWGVVFANGLTFFDNKNFRSRVRAVLAF